ncbi:MAG: flagellar biosynthesis protein [Lachnospiraceae bacterium]|nr:flagellar biosynthesis protein [Lachnospiraceae bacterium]
MPERIQRILNRILEWWKQFTSRQKALILSAIAVVVMSLGILGFVVTRPTNIDIVTAKDATEANTIKGLFDGQGIWYQQSQDGMTFTIHKDAEADATILLGTNGIYSNGYSGGTSDSDYPFSNVVDGSFTTTEADKQRKNQYFLQKQMEQQLESLSNVKTAQVNLNIPADDGTLAASKEEASANVLLGLSDSMSGDQASAIAKYIATGLGNTTTKKITIIDSDDNILFSGGEESTSAGQASSNLSVKQQTENYVANKVKKVLSENSGGNAVYDNVQVSPNLSMDFSKTKTKDFKYSVADGMTQGYLDSRTEKTTSSDNGTSGTPGTDSNDDPTYVTEDSSKSHSESSDVTEDYLPNETITTTEGEPGAVDPEKSSIAITAYNNVIYDEDTMKASGQLNGTTFDEFVSKNSAMTSTTPDASLITAVSRATGIPEANISITSYDVPQFHYSENGRTWVEWLEIAMAVLIFLLLGFVAFRSFKKEKEEEAAEEVSVETLLEEQQEEENLEDIGYNEKSEARLLIEKFVDEKPEAVANLLRNWLNEDWGE